MNGYIKPMAIDTLYWTRTYTLNALTTFLENNKRPQTLTSLYVLLEMKRKTAHCCRKSWGCSYKNISSHHSCWLS